MKLTMKKRNNLCADEKCIYLSLAQVVTFFMQVFCSNFGNTHNALLVFCFWQSGLLIKMVLCIFDVNLLVYNLVSNKIMIVILAVLCSVFSDQTKSMSVRCTSSKTVLHLQHVL